MNDNRRDPVDELEGFLQELEALAPIRDRPEPMRVVYRKVRADEAVDDSVPPQEPIEEPETEAHEHEDAEQTEDEVEEGAERPPILEYGQSPSGPLAAVDCGIVRLGETEDGLVIALRASVILVTGNGMPEIKLFRTGPIYLQNHRKIETLYRMGIQLGRPDFFVEIDRSDPDNPRPIEVKRGVADDAHQYGDRFRNWLERLVQKIAVTSIENGIVLFDGALTLRTNDTPQLYVQQLSQLASQHGNAIIAISKQSLLQVDGRPIRFWLSDAPNMSCYRWLSGLLRRERAERVLGNVYAARFSPLGPTLRMDAKPVDGQSDDEAIAQFYSSALIRGGYPDVLVQAHVHSYFTSPDVVQLQAQAGARYELAPEGEADLSGIFGPFGGRFK